MSLENVNKHAASHQHGWLLSLPDSAYVAGTTFSCALIEDNWELHLIPSLELQAILHFFYMEEQLLALTNFICDEAKLRETKISSVYKSWHYHYSSTTCDFNTDVYKQLITTWSLTHSTMALRWGTTLQAIFCPVWGTVQSWNFTSSPFCRQSALFTIPMIPKG